MKMQKNVLVVGSGSRIGADLVRNLGSRAVPVSRKVEGCAGEIVVDDYAALPPSAFDGIERVVNCVGVTAGPANLMDRVNIALPVQIARVARDSGARQFVHISSFSVYGDAERIERATNPMPVNDYGRSKLAADRALLELASDRFAVTVLRLPLVYASASHGKLIQLIRLWSRIRVLPIPSDDICRSMISASLAAEVLAHLASQEPQSGVVFAADPRPFTYKDAAGSRCESLVSLPIPGFAIGLAKKIAPNYARRLTADNHLADIDNLSVDFGLASRLYRDIAKF
jgi:UDP-glucose 4-epimerase